MVWPEVEAELVLESYIIIFLMIAMICYVALNYKKLLYKYRDENFYRDYSTRYCRQIWDIDVYRKEQEEGDFKMLFSWQGKRDWWSFFVGNIFCCAFFFILALYIRPVLFYVAYFSLSALYDVFWLGVFGVTVFTISFFFANLSKRLNTVGIDEKIYLNYMYIYMILLFTSFFANGIIFFILFLLSFSVATLQEKTDGDLD